MQLETYSGMAATSGAHAWTASAGAITGARYGFESHTNPAGSEICTHTFTCSTCHFP